MNLLLSTIIITKVFAYATAQYDIQPDNCEPLTYELIAGLVTKEARQLLTFTDSSSPAVSSARGTRAITLKKQQKQLKQVKFDLYTRLNPKTAQVLRTDDQLTLINSNFNNTWPVRILIHGWFGQRRICSNFAIKDAYLNIGDFNVILVDWSDYTLDINYLRVILEMLEVGKQLNSFVHFLHHSMGIQYKDVYLIGHSLGCHVAGLAGRLLRPERYGVIYALDAAGPLVKLLGKDFYLTKHDALYVESIQTDVGMFGFRSSIIGHASFLPNWGLGQPHCPNATNVPDFTCDHFGALFYFIESLYNAKAFGAIKCPDYASVVAQKCGCGRKRKCPAAAFMGGEPAVPKRGIYYLSTRPEQPFGYGEICRIKRAIDPIVIRIS